MRPEPPSAGPSTDAEREAARWWLLRCEGLNPAQAQALQAWLEADASNPARLQRMQRAWERLGDLPPADQARWRASASPAQSPGPARRRFLLRAPQLALVGVLGTVGAAGWLGWRHVQQQPVYGQEFVAGRGQQLSVELPDGSRLRLDTLTRLQVSFHRDRREVVLLDGRAFFDVRSDPLRPFTVRAGTVRVEVVGTRFSVGHRQGSPGGPTVQVLVEEGHVRVRGGGAVDAVGAAGVAAAADMADLRTGDGWQRSADGSVSRTAGAADWLDGMAWREGRIVLRDVTLAAAIAEFERYGDTGLVLADPALADLRLNGSFGQREVRAFRAVLPKVLPVRLRPRADGGHDIVRAP